MTPDEFVDLFARERASAILRTDDPLRAREAMEAAVRAGFRVIEFTYSIPRVLDLVSEFAARPGLVVGVGTVLTRDQARDAVDAGARFLVSPVVAEEMIAAARDLGVAAIPGASTPTEMLRAWERGAPLQKLFPGQGIGPAWVAQTLGPLPFLRIVPTSGVTEENAAAYLSAGAHAVGFVKCLFEPDDLAEERYERIEARARRMLAAVRSA